MRRDDELVRALLVALFVVAACDSEPPQLHAYLPDDGDDMRGIRFVEVFAEFSDESPTDARLYADRTLVAHPQPDCNDNGRCVIETRWDTSDFEIGTHELELVLEDDAGNTTRETHALHVDDVLEITSMRVANLVDDSGTLEIEAYAFDDATNELIGCAGSRQNLGRVDAAEMTYALDAILITPEHLLLATSDFTDRRIRIEVWEDDDDPVCPVIPNPAANDLVGVSEAHTAEEWGQLGTVSFGNVTGLEVVWSRRLVTGEDPGTVIPDHDDPWLDFGGGGGGCSATRGGTAMAWWLAALAALASRRRRSRARA